MEPSAVPRHDTVFEERGYTGTSLETDERERTENLKWLGEEIFYRWRST